MALFDFLFGSKDKTKKLDTMTPEQKKFLNQMLQMLGGQGGLGAGFGESTNYLRDLMDPSSEAVNQFTGPYQRQFEQETVPMLAERFAGAGGGLGGGLSSSGFGQALGAAGGNLQTQLAALKAGLGQQAAGQLMSMFGNLSGQSLGAKPFGYMHQPGGTGLFGQALSSWGQGGFQGIPQLYSKIFG
ncbi:MAG TPA: hypothetical protein VGK47_14850 [Nitrososphaeraceae archaeon]